MKTKKNAGVEDEATQVLTIRDAARRLTISVPTLRRLIREKRLRTVRVGPRRIVVPAAALREFLERG